ncbi:unnamed protein product [Caenorhabditis nigoni]
METVQILDVFRESENLHYYVMQVSDEDVAFTVNDDGRILIYHAPGVSKETLKKWDPENELLIFSEDLNEKNNWNGSNQKMETKDSNTVSVLKKSEENPDVYLPMDKKMRKEKALFAALLKLVNRKEAYEWFMANRRIPEEHEFHVSKTIRVLKQRVEYLKDSEEEVQSNPNKNH